MAPVNRRTVVAGVVLTGATALVLLIVCLLQDRPVVHLTLLFAFLLGAGGATILGAVLAVRRKLPFGVRSLRAQLVILCVMTALMGLVTSGFTTALMLLSTQDLAILAGLLGYSLAVSVIVAFAFADTTAGSIGSVLAALRSMNTGNLDVRVKARSPDEVGELAEAVNALARRLQASLSRERDLIRDVSHDLRTPLAAIRAMVESVNDGVVDDPETVRRYLRATQLELEQLTRLINDLFDLSQLDAGALELRIEPASIGDLISDTIESMSAQAAARGLALDGRVDADLPAVMMDAQRVQRVLNNLVDNAIRHTPSRGAIFIEARGRRSRGAGGRQGHRRGPSGSGVLAAAGRGRRRGGLPVPSRGRFRPGARHRHRHRPGPRGTSLAGERRGRGQQVQLHPAQIVRRVAVRRSGHRSITFCLRQSPPISNLCIEAMRIRRPLAAPAFPLPSSDWASSPMPCLR